MQIPLYVDLDGTLIKTDLLFEGLFLLLRQNPFYLFLIPLWLLGGRAKLKSEVASRTTIGVDLLPTNPEFLAFLNEQKQQGRPLILISASDENAVEAITKRFSLFDEAIGSDGNINLKAKAKLERIQQHCSNNEFAYAGNSSADIPVRCCMSCKKFDRLWCSTITPFGLPDEPDVYIT